VWDSLSPYMKTETDPVNITLCFLVIYNFGRWAESINPAVSNIMYSSMKRNMGNGAQVGYKRFVMFQMFKFHTNQNKVSALTLKSGRTGCHY
jgi:hypothetical protein